VKRSNELLIKNNSSVADSLATWQENLRFVKISYEVAHEIPEHALFTTVLYNVAKGVGRDYLREFNDSLFAHGPAIVNFFKTDRETFAKSCAFQLQGLSEQEINDIYKNMPNGCYVSTKQEYMQRVQQIVDEYKSGLAKLQLRKMWKEKTGTAYPYEWSTKFKTPLLSCVPSNKWNDYKRAFGAVNRQNPEDSEVKYALEFLAANPIWDVITNQESIDTAFVIAILGGFKSVLTDLNEVREHLTKNTTVSPYDWSGNSEVAKLVRELAQSKYSKEPYERVMKRIDSMDGDKLRDYLKRLVKGNMIVGIEILEDGMEE
jgi:hypothetical protein